MNHPAQRNQPKQPTTGGAGDAQPRNQGLPAPSSHYENFPVASWLCPPRLRPAVAAIYWFARTADDIADEGQASAAERLRLLALFRDDLACVARGQEHSGRWPEVFDPLRRAMEQHGLPEGLLASLLSAFEQDVRKTRDAQGYETKAELYGYCSRSANPVGRLLLFLYGMKGARDLADSDCICTALQLINFWQDLSRDLPRGRFYLPDAAMKEHGVTRAGLMLQHDWPASQALIADQVAQARALMLRGAPLARRIPGRAGWELRLVVQGGLRILDKIEAMGFATLRRRPRLGAWDLPVILWRALRMA